MTAWKVSDLKANKNFFRNSWKNIKSWVKLESRARKLALNPLYLICLKNTLKAPLISLSDSFHIKSIVSSISINIIINEYMKSNPKLMDSLFLEGISP